MRVDYRPALGWFFVGLGGFLVVGSALVGTGDLGLFLAGSVFAVSGILMLTRTYFEFDPQRRTVVLKALAGPVVRRFGGDKGELHVDGAGRIVCIRPNGGIRKLPVRRGFARAEQWDAVVAQIAASRS